jgi:hypothetical protein
VWSRVGRAGQTVATGDYEWAARCCCDHLADRYAARLTVVEVRQIVQIVLGTFWPPLFVRHIRGDPVGPEEILRQMNDLALDRALGEPTVWADQLESFKMLPPRAESDSALLANYFGGDVTVSMYRAALRQAHLKGEREEFLVVTEYLDILDRNGRVKDSEVSDALSIDESRVRQLLFRFHRRLGGLIDQRS